MITHFSTRCWQVKNETNEYLLLQILCWHRHVRSSGLKGPGIDFEDAVQMQTTWTTVFLSAWKKNVKRPSPNNIKEKVNSRCLGHASRLPLGWASKTTLNLASTMTRKCKNMNRKWIAHALGQLPEFNLGGPGNGVGTYQMSWKVVTINHFMALPLACQGGGLIDLPSFANFSKNIPRTQWTWCVQLCLCYTMPSCAMEEVPLQPSKKNAVWEAYAKDVVGLLLLGCGGLGAWNSDGLARITKRNIEWKLRTPITHLGCSLTRRPCLNSSKKAKCTCRSLRKHIAEWPSQQVSWRQQVAAPEISKEGIMKIKASGDNFPTLNLHSTMKEPHCQKPPLLRSLNMTMLCQPYAWDLAFESGWEELAPCMRLKFLHHSTKHSNTQTNQACFPAKVAVAASWQSTWPAKSHYIHFKIFLPWAFHLAGGFETACQNLKELQETYSCQADKQACLAGSTCLC